MNLPAGTAVKTGVDLATVDFPALLDEVRNKGFNGYLCITIKGMGGFEEGTLVFDNGKIVGCFYEYYRHDKTLTGEKAFYRSMNASQAKFGTIDIMQLTNEQVQLIIAFNENAIFVPVERDLRNFKLTGFSADYENEIAEKVGEERESLMRKFKLAGVK